MARKKVEETIEKALDENVNTINKVEKTVEKMASDNFAEETKIEYAKTVAGQVVDKIGNEDGGKLFDKFRSMEPVKPEEGKHLSIRDEVIKVNTLDRFELFTALGFMVDIMSAENNKIGYKQFIQLTDEFEFMFYLSFFTEVGFHRDIEGYMAIHSYFDSVCLTEKFYDMISKERAISQKVFQAMYSLWEKEYLATLMTVANNVSPMSTLAERAIAFLESANEAEDIPLDKELGEAVLNTLRNQEKQAKQKELPDNITTLNGGMFQKRNIDKE